MKLFKKIEGFPWILEYDFFKFSAPRSPYKFRNFRELLQKTLKKSKNEKFSTRPIQKFQVFIDLST